MAQRMLERRDLHAWYGGLLVLHGVVLHVHESDVETLLGRNGACRTSTLRTVMGLTGSRKGGTRVLNAFSTIGLQKLPADRAEAWATVIIGAIFVVRVVAFRRGFVDEFAARWQKRSRSAAPGHQ